MPKKPSFTLTSEQNFMKLEINFKQTRAISAGDINSPILFLSVQHGAYLVSRGLTLKAPVTSAADDIHKYFSIVFQRKQDVMFQVNPLLDRGFTRKIKPYFLRNIKVKN